MRLLSITLTAAALCGFNSNTLALTGPVYPAPGGNSWSPGGGPAGSAGGATWNYFTFDSSAFSQLYWVPSPVAAGLDGSALPMTFLGISGSTATWTVTTPYEDAYSPTESPHDGPAGTGTYVNGTIELNATLTGPVTWSLAATEGFNPSIGAVIVNHSGADYSLNIAFTADLPTHSLFDVPVNQILQIGDHRTQTSFGGGFYYADPISAPEGGTTALLMIPALLGAFSLRRHLAK